MTKRTEASRNPERSLGSLSDLVEFVLQGIELPLHFLKGVAWDLVVWRFAFALRPAGLADQASCTTPAACA